MLVDLIDKSEIAVSRSALSVRSDVADEARALFTDEEEAARARQGREEATRALEREKT